MDGRRRTILIGLVAAVVGVIALTLIEGAASGWLMIQDVRAITFDASLHENTYDSLLGWTGLPNIRRTDWFGPGMLMTNNAQGIRIHRPVTPALAPGMHRAICSGDSFTNGWGVGDSDTFCAQLEGLVPHLETLNMGRGGYGIDQAYLWYKRDGARWPHQLHLFGFIWHDFERMTMSSFWGRPKPVLRVRGDSVVATNVPVSSHWSSPRWTYAAEMFPRLRTFQLVARRANTSETAQLARTEAQIWDVAEGVFRDLERVNRARGSTLVLVYLPTEDEMIPNAHDRRRARLAAFAKQANIPLIDLTEPMRALPRDSSQWFFITPHGNPIDGAAGHYTYEGHRWVAHQLVERLRSIPGAASLFGSGADQ